MTPGRRLAAISALILTGLPLCAEEVTGASGAILRGLDKVSGITSDLTVQKGQSASFGTLTVAVSDCRFPKDNPAANAYAHLTVTDAAGSALFNGWMIAGSPALSALDHARYDVWVMRCISA